MDPGKALRAWAELRHPSGPLYATVQDTDFSRQHVASNKDGPHASRAKMLAKREPGFDLCIRPSQVFEGKEPAFPGLGL